jgi:myosin-5
LENTDNESFSYIGYTDTDTIEGFTDSAGFQRTLESLALIGVQGEKLTTLMRAICIVLQLGNIVFEEDPNDNDKSIVSSTEEFEALGELMGVESSDLLTSLTLRTVIARNEEFKVPLNAIHAKDSCDAFAKEIYAKAFLWLVRSINEATSAERNYQGGRKSGFGIIGLLDIFGFETFETNRFEQLCINYANEKLQSKFTHDIFKSVQQEYEQEGIELDEIKYDDNTDVLDLVEGRTGLLALLNEECVRPGGSDKGFVGKVGTLNKTNACFFTEKQYEDTIFGVRHYAGPVIYDATGFVTKNMDTLPTDLQACARKSSNAILAKELGNESMISTEKPAKKRPPSKKVGKTNAGATSAKKNSNLIGETVWTKFKNQLNTLMTNLASTRSRYIRCIKPNEEKQPLLMEHLSTVEQLRCAGVVAAVTISRSAFPNRLDHEIVLERFKSLWRTGDQQIAMDLACEQGKDDTGATRFIAECLLTVALKESEVENADGSITRAFVMGQTRTYFRAGALESLESQRLKFLGIWATKIQKIVRSFVAFKIYRRCLRLTICLQALARKRSALNMFRKIRAATILLQCWFRSIAAMRLLTKLRRQRSATLIQTHWRMKKDYAIFRRNHLASVVIQTMWRGALQRKKFRVALHEKREEAKLENQVRALQRKLEEAERRRIEAEKNIEKRAREAMNEFELASGGGPEEEKVEKAQPSIAEEAAESESIKAHSVVTPAAASPPIVEQMSEQQQQLMDESGKMLEYLRKEVFKLRDQNAQIRNDFDLLKENNQRLMDANASAGASFAALNQHAKQLKHTNERLLADLNSYKASVHKLNVLQVELKEELKMKQATYIAEVHSRLQYQKGLAKITDMLQERCRDTRLVEDILRVAEACDGGYGDFASPSATTANKATGNDSSSTLLSTFRSLWS